MEYSGSKAANPIFLLLASFAYCITWLLESQKASQGSYSSHPSSISSTYFLGIPPPAYSGVSSFFLTWIASFKLLLFCFDKGPLANCKSYLDFVLVSIFPLKIKENKTPSNIQFMSLYEPVSLFNKPYLATSLQDFWGRRWNRYSSNILRTTIYDPTWKTLTGIIGIQPAKVVALIFTLVVSGIMHEMLFYYITCAKKPTSEVTWFFVLQGLCMALEAVLKKLAQAKGWTQIHPAVSRSLTCGFVVASFFWLLVLPVRRNGQNDCGFRRRDCLTCIRRAHFKTIIFS